MQRDNKYEARLIKLYAQWFESLERLEQNKEEM